jgi:uroporphyrinogen decarboxylase
MECTILRPDLIDRYLDAQMPSRRLMIEEAFRRGVDGILAGNDWASAMGPLISPQHYRRFIVPRFRQIADRCRAHGKVLVKHSDGDIRRLETILFDECQIDGWHPVDPTVGLTIADYKARYGDRLTLIGNVNCATTLVSGTREGVIAETRAIIRDGAPEGGFILSSSNSIHAGVKPELYAAMLEAAREYGTYPLDEERL